MNIILSKKSLKYFSIGFFSMLGMSLLQLLSRYAEDVLDKGFSFGYIMKFVFHTSTTLIGVCLLFGILITSIFSYRYYSKNKSIDFRKEVLSGTLIVIAVSILLFCFSNWIIINSKLEMHSILYEMRKTAPGEEIETVNRKLFADNYAMLTFNEIKLKADTLNKQIQEYRSLCDSILGILPYSIVNDRFEKLNLKEYGINYNSSNDRILTDKEAKRATYAFQNRLRNLKQTISEKKKFTKELSTRIALPIILVLLFIIGASFGYVYNDQKSFLLVILALFTITFFLKNEMLIANNLFENGNNTSFSVIVLVTVTTIFFIKGLRKKQEITQTNSEV